MANVNYVASHFKRVSIRRIKLREPKLTAMFMQQKL